MTKPTTNDIRLASLVRSTATAMRACDGASGRPATRFGDRKVFVSAIWAALANDDAAQGCTLATFQAWLLRAMRMQDDSGRPLVVLCRADLVGAMDRDAVQQSEILDRGSAFHFVVDPIVGRTLEYRAR